MPERGVEKTTKTTPQGYPTGKRCYWPFFFQQTQQPANAPPGLIWGLLSGRKSSLERTRSNPIGFSLSDGTKGRVWLARDRDRSKIIGDDRLWRVNTEELLRQRERHPKAISWVPTAEALRRPIIVVGRNDPVRDIDDALQLVKGFEIQIYMKAKRSFKLSAAAARIATCQFRLKTVILHHNRNTATMKPQAFKGLVAVNKNLRRKRPNLRLVVSNPRRMTITEAAA